MLTGKEHSKKLPQLKEYVEDWYNYWDKNNRRFHRMKKMVFDTSLTPEVKRKLKALKKPQVEFNILEAMVSRLRGEFAKQEPSLYARAVDGLPTEQMTEEYLLQLEVIEAHLREIFFNAANDSLEYDIYSDLLAGGFSVASIYTDYVNSMSFDQNINVERVFDPTLCIFDPMARTSHKGDGRYAGEICPRTREEFIEEFGEEAIKDSKFQRGGEGSNLGEFNWSYRNGKKDIILVCYLYEKKKRKKKIVKLSTGRVVSLDDYKKALKIWEEESIMAQPPVILPGHERMADEEYIVRYTFCENGILEKKETNHTLLPLVFIDGNSVLIKDNDSAPTEQMTRPYVYHAKDIQQVKNFAGQTMAAEIEDMVMHKWKAPVEGIPEKYIEAYKNPQEATVLLYNAFVDGNPDQPIPPPEVVQRTPTPQIVTDTFFGADKTVQLVLGSYDAQLGEVGNSNGTSGKAIMQGAMHSDAASLPYLVGYIKGIERIGNIILSLIPKYYVTPRTLPVMKPNGKRDYVKVNNEGGSIFLNYDPNSMQIKVEAGVNSSVAKQMALEQIIRMSAASEVFANFMNQNGLETLLSNMDIRGIENLKAEGVKYMENLRVQAEAEAEKPDPMEEAVKGQLEIEGARVQVEAQKAKADEANEAAKRANESRKLDIEFVKVLNMANQAEQKQAIEREKANAEIAQDAVKTVSDLAARDYEE